MKKAKAIRLLALSLTALMLLTGCQTVENPADHAPEVTAEAENTAEPTVEATLTPTAEPTEAPTPTPEPSGTPEPSPIAVSDKFVLKPKVGDLMGHIDIEAGAISEDVIYGTTNEILAKNVGCYTGTLLPGEGDGILISAHRDQHFRGLKDVKEGDKIVVTTAKGQFTYVIERCEVVEKDDQQAFQVFGEETLVLSTCYPFYYVGSAPQRYLVFAPLESFIPAA